VRKHTTKRVPECIRLRNHIIIVTIFSPIDLKRGKVGETRTKGSIFQPPKIR
jgi:hypothetical protein